MQLGINNTQSTTSRYPPTAVQGTHSPTTIGITAGFGGFCVIGILLASAMVLYLVHLYRTRRDAMVFPPLHTRPGSRVRFSQHVHVVTITELLPETGQTVESNPQNTGDRN